MCRSARHTQHAGHAIFRVGHGMRLWECRKAGSVQPSIIPCQIHVPEHLATP